MLPKGHQTALVVAVAAAFLLGFAEWHAMQATDRAPRLLTGELWQRMSPDAKVAFVWGIGNLVDLEWAQTGAAGAVDKSFIPSLVRGLRGHSINDVVRKIDEYYATHPGELEGPVIDAILQTVAIPAIRADDDGGKKAVTGKKTE